MRAIALLLAVGLITLPASAHAGPDEKAIHRAMEQQRKAAEAEMRRQAEYEKKVVEQQQRAMREQIQAEHKYAEMERKAIQERQKAILNQQKALDHAQAAKSHSTVAAPPHITTTQTATPVYHAARPYYGHHYSGHAYHRTSYRHYRTMPTGQVDPETRALLRLKASLDSVRMGSPATVAEKSAIKKALMGVVEVPKVPTIAALESLSGHLAEGLANRTQANAQTGPMALTLRGALNSTEMMNYDLTEIMNEHRNALKTSKVQPAHITPIMESLKLVSSQERARR